MTHFIDGASTALLGEVASSAVRSFLLAGIALATIVTFRLKGTSHRLFVWTWVLYASLALPVLGLLLPSIQMPLPELLHSQAAPTASSNGSAMQIHTALSVRRSSTHADVGFAKSKPHSAISSATPDRPSAIASNASRPRWWQAISWSAAAALIYLTGASFLLSRFVVGTWLSRKMVREARGIPGLFEADIASRKSAISRIAMSDRISVPLTVGVFRSTVLLPADWGEWDGAKLRAVLAHEGSHAQRRDPLTQSISLLYRAFFWFSPLAWWLHRHLETLAEQASDEAALSCGADQKHYARTLLSFFEVLRTSPGRVRWQGVSMARAGQAERRLERILNWKGTVPMSLKRSFAVAALVLAVPVVVLVAAVRPVNQVSAAVKPAFYQEAPSAPASAPVAGVSATAPVGSVTRTAPAGGVSSSGAAAGIAPVAPEAPIAPIPPQASGNSYAYGYDDDERYVITSGKSDSYTMSGSTQDVRHVEKLKKQIPGEFIWFQRDEESYIIRDQATVDRARKLFGPQEALGKKQEELGKQQEVLGKQQEELGKKMEQVRINVPDMTAELDRLKAKLQKLGPTATMEQIGDLQSEIGELQSKIGDLQGRAGEEQGKLGAMQGELGEKQGKLGEEQGELGRQQGELAEKAQQEMKELLDEAIKNGTAKPERETVKSPSL